MKDSISKPIQRVDGRAKISGEAKYIGDMHFENILYVKTLRSTQAKAKILSVSKPKLPDGYFIVDKDDVPGVNRMRTVISDHPLFAEGTVEYIGQPILLVVGPDREIIFNILTQVVVKYENLDPLYTLEEAEARSKVFTDYHYEKGEPQKAFAGAVRAIS